MIVGIPIKFILIIIIILRRNIFQILLAAGLVPEKDELEDQKTNEESHHSLHKNKITNDYLGEEDQFHLVLMFLIIAKNSQSFFKERISSMETAN